MLLSLITFSVAFSKALIVNNPPLSSCLNSLTLKSKLKSKSKSFCVNTFLLGEVFCASWKLLNTLSDNVVSKFFSTSLINFWSLGTYLFTTTLSSSTSRKNFSSSSNCFLL